MKQAPATTSPHQLKLMVLNPETEVWGVSEKITPEDAVSTLCSIYATNDLGLVALLLGYQSRLTQQGVGKRDDSLLNPNNSMAFVQAMAPQNPVEAMLASQMLAVHHHTMETAARIAQAKQISQHSLYLKHFNQLATTFAKQAEALHKLRNGGKQTIQVLHQHVQAEAGSQVMMAQKG
jgi:hypothetical protein